METQQFQRFLQARSLGLPQEANLAMQEFIASFANLQEKVLWTQQFLASAQAASLSHLPDSLWQQVIAQALLAAQETEPAWVVQASAQCQRLFAPGLDLQMPSGT